MKHTLVLLALVFLVACQSKEEGEAVQSIDSLVIPQAPVNTGAPIVIDSASGLLADRARMRTPEHRQTLARFQPLQVVQIYRGFRPLRKPGLEQTSIDSFLATHKITLAELKAILSEGDQLGWNAVDANGKPVR